MFLMKYAPFYPLPHLICPSSLQYLFTKNNTPNLFAKEINTPYFAFKLDNLFLRAEQVSYGIFYDSCTRRMLLIDNCFLSQYATITEENLSRILNFSIRQLQRFLKENYGKTFVQMRRTARLNKAAELLEKGFSAKRSFLAGRL